MSDVSCAPVSDRGYGGALSANNPSSPWYFPRRVIGLTGLAGSGKSAVARYLVEQHGFTRGKFAGALKEMLRAYLRYRGADESTIERMMEGDLKERPTSLLNDRSPRRAMLTLGTEWGRDLIHPDIWVDTEMDARADDPRVVFDDVRFPNEHAAILRVGGIIVNIIRPGHNAIAIAHESESYEFEYDVHLINDGSLGDLFRRIDHRIVLDGKAKR